MSWSSSFLFEVRYSLVMANKITVKTTIINAAYRSDIRRG